MIKCTNSIEAHNCRSCRYIFLQSWLCLGNLRIYPLVAVPCVNSLGIDDKNNMNAHIVTCFVCQLPSFALRFLLVLLAAVVRVVCH